MKRVVYKNYSLLNSLQGFVVFIVLNLTTFTRLDSQQDNQWISKPQNEWPQITLINSIEYVDK